MGAHPDFYAYLCRDDGTTLATHQFTEGQTSTSLTFTEPDYGTFTYQLKLGTTVVSSHTETYVRPTPTYTASFSTNELTLTASITGITNAHNSFAITLERDDGTELSTHTLADGETSFTFTQTETSYATFNYIVKLNGAQTDAYSATYTPPPTPTFDIALTNDDLAITATLTNIVNPDPYYTFMIHDANDTHMDGHTFTTGDTTVVLTWTESSYGEKTYTKLLNGASIGTETITLTDPNASTSLTYSSEYQSLVGHAEPQTGDFLYYNNNGTPTQTEWVILDAYSDNDIRYKKNQSGWSTYQQKKRGIGWTGSGWTEDPWSLSTDKEPDLLSNDGTFPSASATCVDGATIYTWTTGGASYAEGSFISPFYEAPSTTYTLDSTDFPIITPSSGDWSSWAEYRYRSDDVLGYVYYDLWNTQAANGGGFSYDEDDNTNNDGGYQIRVSKTTGDWSDYPHTGTHPPTGVSTTNGNVALGTLFTFVKPSGTYQNKSQTPWDTPSTPVEPNVLAHTNSALYTSYEWRYHSQTTTHYRYGMYHIGNDVFFDVPTSLIQVGKSGQSDYNTWSDANTLVNPNQVVDNGTTVSLNYSGTPYSFNKPTSASWISTPTYRTGTSKGFAFTSGAWKNNGYSAVLDDEANSSSGKLVNGVRQFEWDMPDIGGGRLYSGANNWIYFVPGTAEDNGTWYHSSTSTGGTAGTRNGRVISIGTSATFDETNAFVDGLVPYGDIP